MSSRLTRRSAVIILLAGAAYLVFGAGTAPLAEMLFPSAGAKVWRLAAWLLSLVVFGVHLSIERNRPASRWTVALRVALGVAVGALAVAALGPMRAHWGEPHRAKLAALSLVAWPLVTGVPAFCVALIADYLLERITGGVRPAPSRAA